MRAACLIFLLAAGGCTSMNKSTHDENDLAARTSGSRSHDWSDPAERQRLADHRRSERERVGYARFERPDGLQRSFTEAMLFLYDRRLYDAETRRWRVEEFLDAGRRDFGGYDQAVLWVSYPRLGVDRRSQFDLFDDLPPHRPPGNTAAVPAVRHWVATCHAGGVRVLIGYNPWDTADVPFEQHREKLINLLRSSGADGVYLDTMHEAPADWPAAMAEALGREVAFESEGQPAAELLAPMHSTWGQGYEVDPPARFYPLRHLFPRHKIFLTSNRHSRDHWNELRAAWFTGSGVVVWENVFGNDTRWVGRDRNLLKSLSPLMRAMSRHFADDDWEPFVASGHDKLAVNRWPGPHGTLLTMVWGGEGPYDGPLVTAESGRVYLDLITGKSLAVRDGQVVGHVDGRGVGAVLLIDAAASLLPAALAEACPGRLPGWEQVDTRRIAPPAEPVLGPRCNRFGGKRPAKLPEGMVWVAGGRFRMKISHPWHGSTCYPHDSWGEGGRVVNLPGFAIDRTPVTNGQFAAFLAATAYQPADPRRFLAHWTGGKPPAGQGDHPVVWVSPADARAYAAWAGKRLPSEAEWQCAAQGDDGRVWPWGNQPDHGRMNNTGGTVAVGTRDDASPAGCRDMVGHVWQWVDDRYVDEMNCFTVLKGGSFFRLLRDASKWYLHAGPLELTSHAKIALLDGGAIDRFATVGFRCVAD